MAHKVTLIPGDGIGPEVVGAAVRILEATGVKFEWESYAAGADAFIVKGAPLGKLVQLLVDDSTQTPIQSKGA